MSTLHEGTSRSIWALLGPFFLETYRKFLFVYFGFDLVLFFGISGVYDIEKSNIKVFDVYEGGIPKDPQRFTALLNPTVI